jgi:site-specific DNA recombinase
VFDPDNIDETLDALHAASAPGDDAEVAKTDAARKRLADCDKRLARYRAALDSGADPAVVTAWIAEVQAERLAAKVELDRAAGHNHGRLSREQLAALVNGLGNLLDVLADAAPEDKAEVYRQLGLRLTHDPARRVVIAESDPWAKVSVGEGT